MKDKIIKALPELLSRLIIGWVFIESGWGKFHSLEKVTAYFESLGIPLASVQAPFVSTVEFLAGFFILIGLKARWAAIPLIGIMLVAIRTAKWDEITDFSSALGVSEFLYIAILLWIFSYGAQVLSVDQLLTKRR